LKRREGEQEKKIGELEYKTQSFFYKAKKTILCLPLQLHESEKQKKETKTKEKDHPMLPLY